MALEHQLEESAISLIYSKWFYPINHGAYGMNIPFMWSSLLLEKLLVHQLLYELEAQIESLCVVDFRTPNGNRISLACSVICNHYSAGETFPRWILDW